jgi:hypothetical protein
MRLSKKSLCVTLCLLCVPPCYFLKYCYTEFYGVNTEDHREVKNYSMVSNDFLDSLFTF